MSASLWTVKDCAAFLQLKPQTVRVYVSQGKLPYLKIGTNVRFHPDEIRAWAAAQRGGVNHAVTNAFADESVA